VKIKGGGKQIRWHLNRERGVATSEKPDTNHEDCLMRLPILGCSLAVIFLGGYQTAQKDRTPQSAVTVAATPLILEKNEGEQRVRRPRETPILTGPFTIKVDRKNGGSQKMWLGTEEIPSGGLIPKHQHLGQDEILLIQTGSAHVWLGAKERDVHAGAIVFIPSDTWISLKNTGSENISLAFVFSDPDFDEFMRCVSVPVGSPTPTTLPPRNSRVPI
jgi:quercetin dioxygenase-like cupin family protein